MLHILQIEGLWQHCIEHVGTIFQHHLLALSLCHILVIFATFQTFSILLLYVLW